jgi:hypothetical protein
MFDKLLGIQILKFRLLKSSILSHIDKATSPLLLEPDWETILRLCDAIKSFEVT